MSKYSSKKNRIENNSDTNSNITGFDDFIKYVNNDIKKSNNHYSNNNPYVIKKNNDHLYFLAQATIQCIDKN